MASELDVELEPKRMKKLWEISTSVHRLEVDQLLRTTNHHLPSKNPSNKLKTFPLCSYLSVARSCGFSCSNSSSAVDTR